MWSGTLASIPDGWALCDGTNGTPNLLERFIVSVSAATNPGDTGGNMDPTSMTTPPQDLDHDGVTGSYGGDPITAIRTSGGYLEATGGGTDDVIGRAFYTINEVTLTPKYYKLAFIMKL